MYDHGRRSALGLDELMIYEMNLLYTFEIDRSLSISLHTLLTMAPYLYQTNYIQFDKF